MPLPPTSSGRARRSRGDPKDRGDYQTCSPVEGRRGADRAAFHLSVVDAIAARGAGGRR